MFRYTFHSINFPMAILFTLVKLSLLAVTAVNAVPTSNPLEKRTTVLAYDDIVGFAASVPDDTEGDLYTAYQPYLYVVNGCVPFPAVDSAGDVRQVECFVD
jgi:Necrosis inducing protein (NPP1)